MVFFGTETPYDRFCEASGDAERCECLGVFKNKMSTTLNMADSFKHFISIIVFFE
jgi:hypothetical protein